MFLQTARMSLIVRKKLTRKNTEGTPEKQGNAHIEPALWIHVLVSGVELCAEYGGGEPETKVHVARGNVPQHHIPVSGGAE